MLRFRTISLLATLQGPRRPSRRTAPLILELESRRLLSGQGTVKALVGSMPPLPADLETHAEAAKTNKQTKFVEGLYKKYLHQAPSPAELSYALGLLASGVSRAALMRDFTDLVSKSDKKVSDQAFVTALYVTIAGNDAPTAVGQSYWQGLLTSGDSRAQVQQMFQASHGRLPPPTITWATPTAITYGTALGTAQLNASASLPGTFTYSAPAGTILAAGSQNLSVTFTPSDATDYTTCTGSTTIIVQQATPTIIWVTPASIPAGTGLSGAELDATATCVVGGHTVSVPGTFTYSAAPGTVLPVGSNHGNRHIHSHGRHQLHHQHLLRAYHGPRRWRR